MSDTIYSLEYFTPECYQKALGEIDIDPMFGVLHINGQTVIEAPHAYAVLWAIERLSILEKENADLKKSIKELNNDIAILSS